MAQTHKLKLHKLSMKTTLSTRAPTQMKQSNRFKQRPISLFPLIVRNYIMHCFLMTLTSSKAVKHCILGHSCQQLKLLRLRLKELLEYLPSLVTRGQTRYTKVECYRGTNYSKQVPNTKYGQEFKFLYKLMCTIVHIFAHVNTSMYTLFANDLCPRN